MAALEMPTLVTRSLFHHHTNDSCRSYAADNHAEPITGSLTFHKLMTYISAGAMVVTCLICFLLALGHIFNYREPRVQKQLIRILWTPPVFAIFSFFGVLDFHLANYFTPIAELYEDFALVAVFFLIMALLVPQPGFDAQVAYFSQQANGGYAAFAKRYAIVIQVIPVHVITLIANEVLTAVACIGGSAYRHGHTVLSIINGISNTLALVSLLKLLFSKKTQLTAADPTFMKKLIAFKLIVAIQFIQTIVISILSSANALNGSRTLSYNDLNLGLNSFLITVEVMLISIPMIFFYWPRQYKHAPVDYEGAQSNTAYDAEGRPIVKESNGMYLQTGPKPRLGFFRAIFDAFNMWDIIEGHFNALRCWSSSRGGGGNYQGGYDAVQQGQGYGYNGQQYGR